MMLIWVKKFLPVSRYIWVLSVTYFNTNHEQNGGRDASNVKLGISRTVSRAYLLLEPSDGFFM